MSYIGTSKIGKMPIGSTGIQKSYLGSDLVYQGGLPSGYTEVPYVSTDAQAYIDTGVAGAKDLEISVDFYVTTFIQYGAIYGNYVSESSKCCRAILASASTLYVSGGDSLAQQVNGFSTGNELTLKVSKTEAYLNNVRTYIPASSQADNTTNICLGNSKVGATTFRNIGLRIYSFSIKKDGVLILDYVPCVRDLDSVAGFYDLVAEQFVASGTGTDFVAGT